MSKRGDSKRVRSPMVATNVAAEIRSIPRKTAERMNEPSQRPLVDDGLDAVNQPVLPLLSCPHSFNIILKDDLMSVDLKGLTGQPPTMAKCPALAGRVDPALAKQKS